MLNRRGLLGFVPGLAVSLSVFFGGKKANADVISVPAKIEPEWFYEHEVQDESFSDPYDILEYCPDDVVTTIHGCAVVKTLYYVRTGKLETDVYHKDARPAWVAFETEEHAKAALAAYKLTTKI
jgi:hypothetical protein